jgi:regulator of replication initiation timing
MSFQTEADKILDQLQRCINAETDILFDSEDLSEIHKHIQDLHDKNRVLSKHIDSLQSRLNNYLIKEQEQKEIEMINGFKLCDLETIIYSCIKKFFPNEAEFIIEEITEKCTKSITPIIEEYYSSAEITQNDWNNSNS